MQTVSSRPRVFWKPTHEVSASSEPAVRQQATAPLVAPPSTVVTGRPVQSDGAEHCQTLKVVFAQAAPTLSQSDEPASDAGEMQHMSVGCVQYWVPESVASLKLNGQ